MEPRTQAQSVRFGRVKLVQGAKFRKKKKITQLEGWNFRPAELWGFTGRGCGSLGLPQTKWLTVPLTVSTGLSRSCEPCWYTVEPGEAMEPLKATPRWSEVGAAQAPGVSLAWEVRALTHGVCIPSRQHQD